MHTYRNACRVVIALLITVEVGLAQTGYKKPPKEVLDILNAPVTPTASLSPTRDNILLATGLRNPPLADLSQPMLRLAGRRINPASNSPHRFQYSVGLTLKRVADASEVKIELPPGAKISGVEWSDDGKRFAFLNTTANRVELWVGDAATGKVQNLKAITVNSVMGPLTWMPDNKTLLVQLVPTNRGPAPTEPLVPTEPNTQESSGRPGPVRTYEDLLKTPYDERLFEYYATSRLALVDASSGHSTAIGQAAIFQSVDPAPDGQHLLVTRIQKPFSYLFTDSSFPKEIEVWDTRGKLVYKVASQPLADQVPIDGVINGPRSIRWRPNNPATLIWVQALDGGDPKKKVAHRDSLVTLKAPFTGQPVELVKIEQRFTGATFGEKGGLVLLSDYERDKRWVRTFMFDVDQPGTPPKLLWERNQQDRYNDRGTPLTRVVGGQRAILQNGDWIYLSGNGSSPEGDRPFLDRINLQTLKSERIFRSDSKSYESLVALLNDDATSFITRRESPTEAPNYYVLSTSGAGPRALTQFPDPTPQLRGIKKQIVTYKRADGVQCSFTLYLPPDYKEGTRLPTVVWAYPLEFNDAGTAGQITGSTQRATSIVGPSHLFFLMEGYAVLDNATMPVVGSPETVNNTYVEQIVMSAKAAIDKATEMGVTDPDRVGVGGHSYGAFMTANLLAHSDLFRAGIARSGAYNRTLTPFGFQNERRTIWEAPDLYLRVSPFMFAQKINEPMLMIHGEADDNTGTFPIQSERMYQAMKGNGATVRLVMLPHEAHGYSGRESIEHVLYEMISWFDKYVKNAPPRNKETTTAQVK